MDDLNRTKALLEQLNVGVLKSLEKKTGICKIESEPRRPADRPSVLSWEQRNTCFLPEDLKNFYLTSDGFQLTWSVKMDNGPVPVGKMNINRISHLCRIGGNAGGSMVNPSLADLDCDSDMEDGTSGLEKPTFDARCKNFELDPCDGFGKVCLVYRESKTDLSRYIAEAELKEIRKKMTSEQIKFGGTDPRVEIWFLDRGLRWHYIAESFTSYYRLMIMHLGLPQWQYAFTDIGLSQQAKQWFNLYAPLRLELDAELGVEPRRLESSSSTTQIDVGKVFKGKTDKKKPVPAQTQSQQSQSVRKKPVVTSAKTGPPAGVKSSGSLSQMTGKGGK